MRDEVQIFGQTDTPDTIRATVAILCQVGYQLSRTIARGGLDQALGGSVGINSDGDGQKALDVIADEAFMAALKNSDVRWYADCVWGIGLAENLNFVSHPWCSQFLL